MIEVKIILQTNWTDRYQQEPIFKYVLKVELHDGKIFSYLYNAIDEHNTGWNTQTFFDFEKALKFYMKRIAEYRKTRLECKLLKIEPVKFWEGLDE